MFQPSHTEEEPPPSTRSTDALTAAAVTPKGFEITHPQHEEAIAALVAWGNAIIARQEPYWLSLLGHWGCGKTVLSRGLLEVLRYKSVNVGFREWVGCIGKMRDGDNRLPLALSQRYKVLIIDDFGKENSTPFAIEKLYELMQRRSGKWTLWTSNFMLHEIATKLDGSISSRLLRDGNKVVAMDKCPDYWLEKTIAEKRGGKS